MDSIIRIGHINIVFYFEVLKQIVIHKSEENIIPLINVIDHARIPLKYSYPPRMTMLLRRMNDNTCRSYRSEI